MKSSINISKETLVKLYESGLSVSKIAEQLGTTRKVITRFFKNYGIELDPKRQFTRWANTKTVLEQLIEAHSKEEVEDLYIKQNKSNEDLQKLFNVKESQISELLKYYNIHKDKAAANKIAFEKKFRKWGSEEAYNEYMITKTNKTRIDKYGSLDNFYNIVTTKTLETRTANGTLGKSLIEDVIFEKLKTVFLDLIRNYHDIRYSTRTGKTFDCDFYSKALDLFIEYQGNWTHGFAEYDSTDPNCIELLKLWQEKAKTSKYYADAITTWTVRDVQKKTAIVQNKLKFMRLYYKNDHIEVIGYNCDESLCKKVDQLINS